MINTTTRNLCCQDSCQKTEVKGKEGEDEEDGEEEGKVVFKISDLHRLDFVLHE